MGKINRLNAFARTQPAFQPALFALRLLAFWLLFFALFRCWFIVWLRHEWAEEAPWAAFWAALPLDLSMAGYLMALPILLWFMGMTAAPGIQRSCSKLITGFNVGVFAIFVFVFGANVFIYEEWHTLLNNRALEYFRTPAAMLDSMSFLFKIGSVLTYLSIVAFWWWLYKKLVGTQVFPARRLRWNFAWVPAIAVFLFLSIRGGTGKMPINESAVYYSAHLFNNHAATNPAWYLLHSLIETRSTENHFRQMDDVLARQLTEQLYLPREQSTSTKNWLQLQPDKRPNVVFILMESMTVQVVEELGGEKGVCPNLSRLIQEGILFENCYSSGYRTDQGLVAILGGFPSQPDQSVVLLQDKAAKLPSVPKTLKNVGYSTAFFYGGQLTFANIGVWLRNQSFELIISEKDFSQSEIKQRWGADDGAVFDKALQSLRQIPQPFFANILTLSLHTPYDVPFQSRWNGTSESDKFLNSAAFADHAIGAFFQKAGKEPWFENTLFVLVADHGHQQPGGISMDQPRARQVPLLITGPLLQADWRGRRIPTIGNHHDIPATILDELGFSTSPFAWSKDLLRKNTRNFAYYANENGMGWVEPQGAAFFPFAKKGWQKSAGAGLDTTQQQTAEAYLQTLYNDFLGL